MNWKGIANWALSGAAAFVAGFFSVPLFTDGASLKVQASAGLAAGLASMLSHLRTNPLQLSTPPTSEPKEGA